MIASTSRHNKAIELDASCGFDLLVIRNFFDSPTCARILDEMQSADSAAATVYKDGAAALVDDRVRRVSRIVPLRETADFITRSLLDRKHEELGYELEEKQLAVSDIDAAIRSAHGLIPDCIRGRWNWG